MAKSLEFLELDFYDPKEVLIAVSFGSVDYRNIGQRKGTFSKTIKMPSTKRNDAFFGYSFDVNNEGFFDSKIRVPIVINEIKFNGTLQLKSIEINNGNTFSYLVNIFSDLADWASLIGEGSIRDLKHHGKHTFSTPVVVDSWNNNTGLDGDYVYPMIGYGNFLQDTNSTFDINLPFWRPAFFSLPIIRQIFKEVGYKFIDSGIKNTKFVSHILPFTSKEVKIDELKIESFRNNSPDVLFANIRNNPTTRYQDLGFQFEVSDFPSFSFNDTTGTFFPPSTDTYDISVDGYLFFVDSVGTGIFGGNKGEKNGAISVVMREVGGQQIIPITASGSYFENKDANSTQVILNGGISIRLDKDKAYRLALRVDMEGKTDIYIDVNRGGGAIDSTIKISPRLSNLVDGSIINHAKFIQNIKKIDLLSDIIKQGNFRIITDNQNKTVEFVEESKFLMQSVEDWSSKVDHSKPVTITNIQNEGAKELVWSYSNDPDDSFIKDYSDRLDVDWSTKRVELESEYRKGVEVVFQSIFSCTIDDKGQRLPMPVMSTKEIVQGEPITRGTFETNFENRCLIYGGLKDGVFVMENQQHEKYPFCYFTSEDFSLQWDNLGDFFEGAKDIGLVDRYYSNSIKRLNNSKLKSLWVNLNELDVSNLSFRKIKMVDGTHYYLNTVTDYLVNNNQSTKVELISK